MATEPKNMWADFIALQQALPVMPKDTTNPFFKSKYTPLDTIVEIAMPIVHKHHFAWYTRPSINEAGEPTLKYALVHASGEAIEGEMKLMLTKADPQGQGSAVTYARRYSLTSVLNIVSDEDDDGNAARKAAAAAKQPEIDPYKAPEEPSVDISESEGITPDVITKLEEQVRLKGMTTKKQIDNVLNAMASTYGAETIKDVSVAQGREIYAQIRQTNALALKKIGERN